VLPPDTKHMDDFVTKVLEGSVSDEEINTFKEKLSEDGKSVLNQALAFRDKRKDEENKANEAAGKATTEEQRLAKAKADADAEEARLAALRSEGTQFRQEQISKAKARFFTEYGIAPENQAQYDTEFTKLDSGKMDPDLIFKDLERTHVALNSDTYLESERKQREMQRNAETYNAGGAGSQTHAPSGQEPPKFSQLAEKIAQDSEISVEAAAKIEKEGYSRFIEG
jgi:hypothetical protein